MISIRFLFLEIFAFGIALISWGQKGTRDISLVKNYYLTLPTSEYSGKEKIPFSRIDILDYRFDTSKVGYTFRGQKDERIVIKGGIANSITNYLNDYFKPVLDSTSPRTLLIILKKLWLQYGATNQVLREKDIDTESTLNYLFTNSVCLADLEAFAVSSGFHQALIKLNHHFTIQNTLKENISLLLFLPFDSLIKKTNSIDVETILAQKKKFSLHDIHLNYTNRFNLPVLIQPQSTRGIFLSFEDFKNNRTVFPDFIYTPHKASTDILITKNGELTSLTEYWGFFDGKELFIKPGLLPFKVVRQGKTFDLYGSFRGDRYSVATRNGTRRNAFITNDVFVPEYPLQLDMETGKVY